MRILSMTATFGKLEQQTLTLEPGLNLISAPNEWGKSTWCAFLIAMLYGLDTRARTTTAALADKEHYQPWSGRAMEGRIDLIWQGRAITIERHTKGRVPMGVFRAYETDTGLDVPELDSVNCGQVLLGVERSVFTRAGFLRLGDLPVTQDEALRRRLNALVTTGDENDDADRLSDKLKDLKNRCRHNRTGLLPEAQAQLAQVEQQQTRQAAVRGQLERLVPMTAKAEEDLARLRNHADALRYEKAQADARRVREACAARDREQARLESARAACEALPGEQTAKQAIARLQEYRERRQALEDTLSRLPQSPEPPLVPEPYRSQAVDQAREDAKAYQALTGQPKNNAWIILLVSALVCLAVGLALTLTRLPGGFIGYIAAAALAVLAVVYRIRDRRRTAELQAQAGRIAQKYGSAEPNRWVAAAEEYAGRQALYDQARADCDARRTRVLAQLEELDQDIRPVSRGEAPELCLRRWLNVIAAWQDLDQARRSYETVKAHAESLQAMARTPQPPARPDDLAYPMEETRQRITQAEGTLRQLCSQRDQYLGQLDAMEAPEALESQAEGLRSRIRELEKTYAALTYAQNALDAAREELQRRFAPRIKDRAQAYFARLTAGRYDRLAFDRDLNLSAGAQDESALRSPLWRSDGTADQLYLALRLAVAEELTPETPLVLDDVLARFDGQRAAAAMEILKELAETRQVIFFHCREEE